MAVNKGLVIAIVICIMISLLVGSGVGGYFYFTPSPAPPGGSPPSDTPPSGTPPASTPPDAASPTPSSINAGPFNVRDPARDPAPDFDMVRGWDSSGVFENENPNVTTRTPEQCRQIALNSNGKYVAWGFRNDNHSEPGRRNTCFLYTKLSNFSGNPNDNVHTTGCILPGTKVSNGCSGGSAPPLCDKQKCNSIIDEYLSKDWDYKSSNFGECTGCPVVIYPDRIK